MQDMKGVCCYSAADARKARDTYGASWVRMDFPGADIISSLRKDGLKLNLIACYALGDGTAGDHSFPRDYQAWANKILARVAGNEDVVGAVECWNEPWLAGFALPKADPVAYHALCRVLLATLRKTHPTMPFLFASDDHIFGTSPGSRTWLDPLLAEDKKHGDVLRNDANAFPVSHNYSGARAPDATGGDYFQRYDVCFQAWNRPVWVTEFGWDPKGGGETSPVSEQQQADYTAQALKIALASKQVARCFVYQAKNEDWYGIWRPDGTARPICAAVKALT